MSRLLFSVALVAILVSATYLFLPQATTIPASEFDYLRTREALADRLAKAQPGSREHRQLAAAWTRARRKAQQTAPRSTNPGLFYDALASIRQDADGRRYPAGQRQRVLREATRLRKGVAATLPWQERGPGNVAGRSRAIVVDAADATGRSWFVGTIGGGVWKTTDAGTTWQHITSTLTSLSVATLAQCTSQPNVLYVGTGMGYGRIVDLEGSGVWKSVDAGATWTQLPSTANGQVFEAVNRIVVDPNDPDIVVLCSNNDLSHLGPNGGDRSSGIFRSTDGGLSWTQTFDPDATLGSVTDNRVQQIVANPANFSTLYATVNEVGVLRSRDGGQSWQAVATNFALPGDIGNPVGGGLGLNPVSVRTEMAIAPSDTTRLYAAVERPRGIADLFMSTDAGDSWNLVNDTGSDPNWFNAFSASAAGGNYSAGWFDNTITVNPYDANQVFVGGVNLYRLDVNAVSRTRSSTPVGWWIPNGNGIPVVHADHHFLVTIPKNPATGSFWVLDANDGGLAVSTNGGNAWTQLTGLGSTQFYGADKKPGASVYIGGMQDNGTWMSGADPTPTSPWNPQLGGDGFEAVFHGGDGNLVLGGSQFGNLSRSADGGASWSSIPDAKAGSSPFISKIANNDIDPDLVFTVSTAGINRSDDFGLSWQNTPIVGPWLGYRPFDNVEISLADPQVVWAHSRLAPDPANGQSGGVYVSADGGLSYQNVTGNLPLVGLLEASGVATHPTDPNTAYLLFGAPTRPKILVTHDLGQSWSDLSEFSVPAKGMGLISVNGFPDVAVFSLLVLPHSPSTLWAGTEIGLFESLDDGATWNLASNGLPNVAIFEMRTAEDQVVVATQGRGVWSLTSSDLAAWTPPSPTLAPRLTRFALQPTGELGGSVDLRSAYDSSAVLVDGLEVDRRGANAGPTSFDFTLPVVATATRTAQVVSWKSGRTFSSSNRSAAVFPAQPRNRYTATFSEPGVAGDFVSTGFSVQTRSGFADPALHSSHSYPASTELVAMLAVPIRVDAVNSTVQYRDVALIEEGVVTNWQNANFFDYVVVEGSRDGVNWLALAPGYDSRYSPSWSSAYRAGLQGNGNSTTQGSASLFVNHSLDLADTFAPGEHVFLRFRLHSDPLAVAWGWAIDDLLIQPTAVGIADTGAPPSRDLPTVVALEQNQPNPFNPRTTIRFSLPEKGPARLAIYDLRGRLIDVLADEVLGAGSFERVWEGTDRSGGRVASGVYFYRLDTPTRSVSRKLTLVE